MTYGYLHVSTDKQTVENQRFEINNYCKKNKIKIDKWIEETISSRKELKKRKLGILINEIKTGDVIISSELSRLGRNLMEVMGMLNHLLSINAVVQTIKDNYRLGADIQSKVLAFAFGISAEIERQLISQRTKEALARMKAEGIHVGRPLGRKSSRVKLTGKITEIRALLRSGIPKIQVAKRMGVHRSTLRRTLKK
ncbi:invertase [Fibrobacteria bacterium R8-3-H12]